MCDKSRDKIYGVLEQFTSLRASVLNCCDCEGFGAADGCPREYSADIALDPSQAHKAKCSYEIGDTATSQCDPQGPKATEWGYFPKKFLVYPSQNRTCLTRGTWSSPPPICIHQEENKGCTYSFNSSFSKQSCLYDALHLFSRKN